MENPTWNAQLRKGAAELAVLAVLAEGDRYGLQILERVNDCDEIISEGAIYPLLSRLEKEGKLCPRWVVDEGSHPRKYYSLTVEGRSALIVMRKAWSAFRTAMNNLLESN